MNKPTAVIMRLAVGKIVQPAEGIGDLPVEQAEGEGVDGEVAAGEVLVERGAGPVPKVDRDVLADQPVGREVLAAQEDEAGGQLRRHDLRDLPSASRDHGVDVVARQPQGAIAQAAPHEMALRPPSRRGEGTYGGVLQEDAEDPGGLGGHGRMLH